MYTITLPYTDQMLAHAEGVHKLYQPLSEKDSEKELALYEGILRLNRRRLAAKRQLAAGFWAAVLCTLCENYASLYKKRP